MFDLRLRAFKDDVFDPISRTIPSFISPLSITCVGFLGGLVCCASAIYGHTSAALTFWCLNRTLDCLDGSVARQRKQASDLGGFLDLLADFIIYSLIPICCAASPSNQGYDANGSWPSVAVLEATFHINNFILFYIAAVSEKRKASIIVADSTDMKTRGAAHTKHSKPEEQRKELTSLSMRPTLIEGAESAALFTIMLAKPIWLQTLCNCMSAMVCIGIIDRTLFLIKAL